MLDVLTENYADLASAFWLTVQLAVISGLVSLVFGTLLVAMRVGPVPVLAKLASVYVTGVRNTPLLVICLIIFGGLPDAQILVATPFLVKGVIAVSAYTAPFVCEALRAGINSVPIGQAEAARSIGLGFGGVMTQVVLPQAYAASIPPMVSVLMAMTKNTSLVAVFGLLEATGAMRILLNNNADLRTQIFVVVALGYIVLVELISVTGLVLERRTAAAR